MQSGRWRWSLGVAAVGALALTSVAPAQAGGHPSAASTYDQVNLVSDLPGKAQITDPNLVNPWGLSFSPTSPLWVSDNGTNVSTLYQGGIHGSAESIVPLVVKIPGGAPTGQTFNGTSDFVVHDAKGNSAPAVFIFDGESGHIRDGTRLLAVGPAPRMQWSAVARSSRASRWVRWRASHGCMPPTSRRGRSMCTTASSTA